MIWEPFDPVSYFIHVGLGVLALAAGLYALASSKGSANHKRAGRWFAYPMLLVALSTFVFMFYHFLPLAIVMALATLYCISSAIRAAGHTRYTRRIWDGFLLVIPLLLCVFAAMQCIRFAQIEGAPVVGPAILALTFGWLTLQDIALLNHKHLEANAWLRRHAVRMVLALTFAIMAVVRIGINFGLTLEQTVVIPLLVAFLICAYFYRRYPIAVPTTSPSVD